MIVGRAHTERTGRLVGEGAATPITRAGRAPCFVAFHGFTGTTSELRPLADAVAERGFAVHAPLLPGHGSTPGALQDTSFEDWACAMAEEVAKVERSHGRFVLCGFSLGSLLAMEIASRRPSGLAGLVVLGNALRLMPPVQGLLGLVARSGWRIPDWYLVKLWSSDVRDPSMRRLVSAYDRDPLRAAYEVYRAGRHVEPKLGEISCPSLVLHGARDRVCPVSNANAVARGLIACEVRTRIFPRSGHLVAVDYERSQVAEEVVRFVESLAS